jgi:hypothetical protein
MAVENPAGLIQEFIAALQPLTLAGTIQHNHQPAPHKGKPLPSGQCAVYVFTLASKYGQTTRAGGNRALKVGKAGINCSARFQSQHYSTRAALSTLASTLLKTKVLWSFIRISSLEETNIRAWIEQNTDRDNFLFSPLMTHICWGNWKPISRGGSARFLKAGSR